MSLKKLDKCIRELLVNYGDIVMISFSYIYLCSRVATTPQKLIST